MDEPCFVIQPFDLGKYDEHYRDIFAPAITDAELRPYRVDNQRQCSPIMIHSEIQAAQESKFRCQLGVNEATLGKTLLLNNRF
jgi:hypothetical protein